MPITDTKNIDGKTFHHEANEYFTSKEDAEIHVNNLKREYKWITGVRIQKKSDGTYWVWWSQS